LLVASCSLLVVKKRIILEAIQPPLARFGRRDDMMRRGLRVLPGVTVRRLVATTRGPARLAGPQVHPLPADLYALLAFVRARLQDCLDRRQVAAGEVAQRKLLG
jgi:hypothetical protein